MTLHRIPFGVVIWDKSFLGWDYPCYFVVSIPRAPYPEVGTVLSPPVLPQPEQEGGAA